MNLLFICPSDEGSPVYIFIFIILLHHCIAIQPGNQYLSIYQVFLNKVSVTYRQTSEQTDKRNLKGLGIFCEGTEERY